MGEQEFIKDKLSELIREKAKEIVPISEATVELLFQAFQRGFKAGMEVGESLASVKVVQVCMTKNVSGDGYILTCFFDKSDAERFAEEMSDTEIRQCPVL